MIGPVKEFAPHPRSLLKRKQPPAETAPQAKRAAPAPAPAPVTDLAPPEVADVCSYETISDYIQLFGEEAEAEAEVEAQGSPASLESGYHTSGPVDNDNDDEDSNLSWLLNFKVSSLFDPAAEDKKKREESPCKCSCAVYTKPAGKPPYTYTELIERALKEQGELTVSGIYNWISSKFPFYSPNDDRWKNSVRHNLSINPHFRKGVKSRHGAGHLWTLSNEGVSPPPDSWVRTPAPASTTSTASASSTVLTSLRIDDSCSHKRPWRRRPATEEDCKPPVPTQEEMDEAAIAAATIMESEVDDHDHDHDHEQEQEQGTPLTRVAEQILSGVKRRVEVQYLVHDHNTNEPRWWVPDHAIVVIPPPSSWSSSEPFLPEFLNPVSKEEIVSESGLDTDHCDAASSLLSDLHTELNLPDNLFSDELAFSCYPQL